MNDGTDYRAILAADTPLLDVRAPIEFTQGAMPAALNLPLMTDDERAAVGTCYKRQGPEAALALGHSLVSGDTREERINAWRDACLANPGGYLCCAQRFIGGWICRHRSYPSGYSVRYQPVLESHATGRRLRLGCRGGGA